MCTQVKVYHHSIEDKIIELILDAKNSIKISMAWFTSKKIKDALIELKYSNSSIEIEIVVDDNRINDLYFFNDREKFTEQGIILHKKSLPKFLHNKFTVIDNKISITGSYNFSNKAKRNSENIAVIYDSNVSSVNSRVFRFLTEPLYIDENIYLLFDHPLFAQKLLSAFYPFTYSEFKKYRDKLVLGYCFTHENGIYDEIKYDPGFIFNPKVHFDKKLKTSEFPLPISKLMIKNWISGRNTNLIIDSYQGHVEEYIYINDAIERSDKAVEAFFKRKIESTYTYEKLKELVVNDIDIIIEDELFPHNFALFFNKNIVSKIFEKIPLADKDYYFFSDFLD